MRLAQWLSICKVQTCTYRIYYVLHSICSQTKWHRYVNDNAEKSTRERSHAVRINDNSMAHLNLFITCTGARVIEVVSKFMARTKSSTRLRLYPIHSNRAGKHKSGTYGLFYWIEGVSLRFSSSYALQSNDEVKRLMQELLVPAHVMLISTERWNYFWSGYLHNGTCLCTRLTMKTMHNNIPFELWKSHGHTNKAAKLPTFSQLGFAFVYLPNVVADAKRLTISVSIPFPRTVGDKCILWRLIPPSR